MLPFFYAQEQPLVHDIDLRTMITPVRPSGFDFLGRPDDPDGIRHEELSLVVRFYKTVLLGALLAIVCLACRTAAQPVDDALKPRTLKTAPDKERPKSQPSSQPRPEDVIARSVSADGLHTCALLLGGGMWCWGDSAAHPGFFSRRQFEDGQVTPPPDFRNVVHVSVGERHSCGLSAGGTVRCWGDNDHGQHNVPPRAFRQLDANGLHACGLTVDHEIACWGTNAFGQMNAPSGEFEQVSTGGLHDCAVTGAGKVVCWGSHRQGQTSPPDALR
jgi:alpha-tubulin suppressor-like RCC1 family protein